MWTFHAAAAVKAEMGCLSQDAQVASTRPEPGSQPAAPEGWRVWACEWQDGCGLRGQSQGAIWDSCRRPRGAGRGCQTSMGPSPGLQGRPRPELEAELRPLRQWRSGTEPGVCALTGAQSRHRTAPPPQLDPVSPPSGRVPEPCPLPLELLPPLTTMTQGPSASQSSSRQRSLHCRPCDSPCPAVRLTGGM